MNRKPVAAAAGVLLAPVLVVLNPPESRARTATSVPRQAGRRKARCRAATSRTNPRAWEQPPETVSHQVNLSGHPGRQTVLAVWNIADTTNALYSCIDVQVG